MFLNLWPLLTKTFTFHPAFSERDLKVWVNKYFFSHLVSLSFLQFYPQTHSSMSVLLSFLLHLHLLVSLSSVTKTALPPALFLSFNSSTKTFLLILCSATLPLVAHTSSTSGIAVFAIFCSHYHTFHHGLPISPSLTIHHFCITHSCSASCCLSAPQASTVRMSYREDMWS